MGEILVQRSGAVVTLTLSDPERRNALSVTMWQRLRVAIDAASADPSLRCVIVNGAKGHFAAGANIGEFPTVRGDLRQLRHYHEEVIAPALAAVAECVHPTLAAIEGVCMGGGLEIAGCCDLRICADSAQLGVPIGRLGFPMAPNELSRLLALAGPAVTLELLLEGRVLSASEALTKGLVSRVVPAADLQAEAWAAASRMVEQAPLASRLNKLLVRRLRSSSEPLSEAEREAAFSYAQSRDHAEGVSAFLEHRAPHFTGE